MRYAYQDERCAVVEGGCLDVLRRLPECSVDSVVCDPPYGLSEFEARQTLTALTAWTAGDREHVPSRNGFMDLTWDAFVPPPAVWDECLRVLKPGGHLVAFAGARTYDLMGLSIRMAGFEIREGLAWLYGAGMPKGLNVGKAIDKKLGAERPVQETIPDRWADKGDVYARAAQDAGGTVDITGPGSAEAAQWDDWHSALKPAWEPMVLARKPLEGSVADNVLRWGVGALNVGACRIPYADEADERESKDKNRHGDYGTLHGQNNVYGDYSMLGVRENYQASARFPSNVILSEEAAREVDRQSGPSKSPAVGSVTKTKPRKSGGYGDAGGASRFFYTAKAGPRERPVVYDDKQRITHPTVKPLALMRWVARLVTPPGGLVVDPFAGSGTTLEAALLEGFRAFVVEREKKYIPLILERVRRVSG
ncbi:MAG: DNA methyltransferase [Candidatus Nanopelagicales bacterium]